jgi:hypothetical protein
MKLFRNLLIAAAAISSFESVAGLISIQPESDRLANYEIERVVYKYSGELTDKIQSDELPASFSISQIGEILFDSGISQHSALGIRSVYFHSTLHQLSKPFQGMQEICTQAKLNPEDCDAQAPFTSRSSMLLEMYQHSDNLFGLSLYLFNLFHFQNEEQGKTTKYSHYEHSVQLYKSYDRSSAPLWLQNLQFTRHEDLVNLLKQSVHNRVRVRDHYQLVKNCNYINCVESIAVDYRRVFIGDAYWQTEAVPLPTTASFLLLGVAGLALRRRLTA